MKKQLPDTPWHIGSPKMKESDHRRLNKWCVHYDSSFCTEPKSGCYMLRCAGSSHCKFYAEDENTSQKIEQDNRTQMEIDADHRRQYVETLKPKMRALVSSSDERRYKSVSFLQNCFVCGSKLLKSGKFRKRCVLCHMEYVNQSILPPNYKVTDGRYVYIMGHEKPVKEQASYSTRQCHYCDPTGKCLDRDSPLFQIRCKPQHCKNLKSQTISAKQTKENTSTGVKSIPINSIVVRNMAPPRQSKLDLAVKDIQRNGGVTKPIYVTLSKDKYLLKDGYIRYLAALQCGLSTIPAILEQESVEKETTV